MSFHLIFERRMERRWLFSLGVILVSLVVGLLGSGFLFWLRGVSPILALQKIFYGSFGSWYGFKETVAKAIPLTLIGTGLTLAFRGRFWNIGAEGQLLLGAIGATGVAVFLAPHLPPASVVPVMVLVGMMFGSLWGLVPALLRKKWRINEVISTLMMNYIAAEFTQYLIYGPMKGKAQMGFPVSDDFPAAAILAKLPASRIPWSTLALAIGAALVLWLVLEKRPFGFEVRVVGNNPDAARYAGIDDQRLVLVLMGLSGGLAGIAGVGEVAGIHEHLTYPWAISAGYGYTAIIVAYLARLNPLGVIPAALFFGGILVGGDVIQTSMQLPFAVVHLFNAIILLALIVGDVWIEYRLKLVRR